MPVAKRRIDIIVNYKITINMISLSLHIVYGHDSQYNILWSARRFYLLQCTLYSACMSVRMCTQWKKKKRWNGKMEWNEREKSIHFHIYHGITWNTLFYFHLLSYVSFSSSSGFWILCCTLCSFSTYSACNISGVMVEFDYNTVLPHLFWNYIKYKIMKKLMHFTFFVVVSTYTHTNMRSCTIESSLFQIGFYTYRYTIFFISIDSCYPFFIILGIVGLVDIFLWVPVFVHSITG